MNSRGDKITEGILVGCCNPMLDLTANVEKSFLDKYGLKPNDAIIAGPEHQNLAAEVSSSFAVHYSAGGSGLNVMRAAQFGMPEKSVLYIGCIGTDENGKIIREKVAEEGLLKNFQVCPNLPSATCCVLLTENHRSLVANLAAARNLTAEHFESSKMAQIFAKARYFYCTGFLLTVCAEAAVKIGRISRETEKTFCFNLSAPFVCEYYSAQMLAILPFVDVLFGNESEAEAFAKTNGIAYSNVEDIVVALGTFGLASNGSTKHRTVIITQGAKPTIALCNGKISHHPVAPIDPALVIDTNGAGDSFCGGFLSQWILGKSLEQCIDYGNNLAGRIIQTSGISFQK